MAKYSLEFKLDLITKYKEGNDSIHYITSINNLHHSILKNWIKLFDEKGVDALKRSRNNKRYNQDFKMRIVQEYLTTNISYSDCQYRTTFHSDGGWAYKMYQYKKVLKNSLIFQSMSRKAISTDNSPMENFFGILKQEMYYGETYHSYDELKYAIEEYITYYNNNRRKKKLNGLSSTNYLRKKQTQSMEYNIA